MLYLFGIAISLIAALVLVLSLPNEYMPHEKFSADVQHVEESDARIAYYVRGEGEPLILIEGFGMSMDDWDPSLLQELSKDHRLIIFDLRGVGLSEGDLSGLSLSQMTDDTVHLLKKLGVAKADVLGWSMGSLVAQEMALKHPEYVNKLILVSTFSADQHTVDGSDQVSAYIMDNIKNGWEKLVPPMFPDDRKEDIDAYLKRREKAIESKEAPRIEEITQDLDVVRHAQQDVMIALRNSGERLQMLSDITQPTLVIAGEEDALLPLANDRLVADAVPSAKLIVIPRAGHAVLFMGNKEVVKEIKQFLQ